MTTVELKENLSDVADDFPVFVKTINGYEHIELAYEEVLFSDNTPLGAEKDAFLLFPRPPKYDPCRRFKKGDEVRLRENNGRNPYDFLNKCTIERYSLLSFIVLNDELDSGDVDIKCEIGGEQVMRIHCSNLELDTPVEEQERYVVEPSDVAWFVVDKKHESGEQNVVMYMCAVHPNPKAAAEAECAQLNAKYRKKQK